MKTKKVIVEIDGERHRLVRGKAFVGNICSKCSLADLCTEELGSPCLHSWDYFVKEKEQKPKPSEKDNSRDSLCLTCSLIGQCSICCESYRFVKEKANK